MCVTCVFIHFSEWTEGKTFDPSHCGETQFLLKNGSTWFWIAPLRVLSIAGRQKHDHFAIDSVAFEVPLKRCAMNLDVFGDKQAK